MKKKVLVGLSGGIDSSSSAKILKEEGFEVEGVYLKLHNKSEEYHKNNLDTISQVASFLGIKYHILDLRDEFESCVLNYFIESYKAGITPNPCVKCNQNIKFGKLFSFAKAEGADYLATGHYVNCDGEFFYEAQDLSKDQSYFLAQVKKEILPYLIFPMAKYKKEDILKEGEKIAIFKTIVEKKESQEICFVPTNYTDFLRDYFEIDRDGLVLNSSGDVIGRHKGYPHYTIGKRKGFSVKGAHDAHFVKSINPLDNTIVVGSKDELEVNFIEIDNMNLYIDLCEFECSVKLRYRSKPTKCKVKIEDGKATVKLLESCYGIALGQLAVFYENKKVLGSGFIIKAQMRL